MAKIGNISDSPGGAAINDSVESAETVYSSEKVKSLVDAKQNAMGTDNNYVSDLEKAKVQQLIIFTYNP